MKCQYCGTELKNNAKFCNGCGAKIESTSVEPVVQKTEIQHENVTPVNNNENRPNYNGQQYYPPVKNNTGLKITIIILILIILLGAGFGIWYFLIRDNGSSEKKDEEIVEKDDDKSKDDDDEKDKDNDKEDENEKDNDEKEDYNPSTDIIEISDETIKFGNYTYNLPKGFTSGKSSGNTFIQNDDCIIMLMDYPMRASQMLEYESILLESFEEEGLSVENFYTKTLDGNNFVILEGKMYGLSYGFMFIDLDSNNTLFLTITSSNLRDFDSSWYNYASKFVSTAK